MAIPMRILFLSTLLSCSALCFAQDTARPAPPQVFTFVEQMPAASYQLNAYLAKNIHYPASAIKDGIQGRVIVQFVVQADGSVTDVNVIRGIDSSCDDEAKRVVSTMPPWKPGKQNGKPVAVRFTLPITFRIDKTTTPPSATDAEHVYEKADVMPAPGYDLREYLGQKLHYPARARMEKVEGKVTVKFIVDENGKIQSPQIVDSLNKETNDEALRVIRTMPDWKPGKQNGKPVKVYFTQPIVFKLPKQ